LNRPCFAGCIEIGANARRCLLLCRVPLLQSWLLDGFPRTIEQAQALESANIEVAAVLSLDVPDNEIIRRVGGTAHVTSKPYEVACAK